MRSTTLSASALLAASGMAAPLEARQSNIDTTVLQFALTLEHLENVFYNQALQKFSQQDFANAGYDATYYQNLKYIAADEKDHVMFLQNALTAAGATPVQQCTYNFPYADVPSFITLSSVLEGVGTSAYLGAAPLITNKQYLTAAGSILVTEAKHTSYQRAAIKEVPFANAYGTPLDPMSVFTLAAMFITSCPDSNMALPFTAYPTLTYEGDVATNESPYGCSGSGSHHYGGRSDPSALDLEVRDGRKNRWGGRKNSWGKHWKSDSNCMVPPTGGDKVTFSAMKNIPQGSFVTFVSGLDVISVPGNVNGMKISATIPTMTEGQTYVFVTKSSVTSISADQVLYGPAIVEVKPQPPQI